MPAARPAPLAASAASPETNPLNAPDTANSGSPRTGHAAASPWRTGVLAIAAGCVLAGLAAPAVHAQNLDNSTSATAASASREFDIPASALGSALIRFGEQAGVQFTVPASLTAGKRAPALKGRYTAEQGLRALLAGSGLGFRFAAPQAIVIEAVVQAGTGAGPAPTEHGAQAR